MKTFVAALYFICIASFVNSQPYYEVALIKGTLSPDAGVWNRNNVPVKYNQFIAGASYPIVLKHDSSKLILSAYTERWQIDAREIKELPNAFMSLIGAVTYVKPISKKWSVAASVIPRWNGNAEHMFDNSFQIGGSLLGIYKKSLNLSYRFGVYYNDEFFGPFVVPLLGIDWKINSRNNLFGILPQILTYENKINDRLYWGANYRMYNNSYRLGYRVNTSQPNYLRIVEMQLLINMDIYLTNRLIFDIEAGHSMFRKLRLGTDDAGKDYYSDEKVNDGFLVKAGFLYRLRLR